MPTRLGERLDNAALRLTFSYRAGQIRLESVRRLTKKTRTSDDTADQEIDADFSYDLRNSAGRVLYRRVVRNPISSDVEVWTGDPGQPFTRAPITDRQRTFSLLVPDLADARTVVLRGRSPEPREAHLQAKEIARFVLARDMEGEVIVQ